MKPSPPSVSRVPSPRSRWLELVGRLAEHLEQKPAAQVLRAANWRGGPERLVDELGHLSPEGALAVARQADAGVENLHDLEKMSDQELLSLAVRMLA